jgi:hypothetical protein
MNFSRITKWTHFKEGISIALSRPAIRIKMEA